MKGLILIGLLCLVSQATAVEQDNDIDVVLNLITDLKNNAAQEIVLLDQGFESTKTRKHEIINSLSTSVQKQKAECNNRDQDVANKERDISITLNFIKWLEKRIQDNKKRLDLLDEIRCRSNSNFIGDAKNNKKTLRIIQFLRQAIQKATEQSLPALLQQNQFKFHLDKFIKSQAQSSIFLQIKQESESSSGSDDDYDSQSENEVEPEFSEDAPQQQYIAGGVDGTYRGDTAQPQQQEDSDSDSQSEYENESQSQEEAQQGLSVDRDPRSHTPRVTAQPQSQQEENSDSDSQNDSQSEYENESQSQDEAQQGPIVGRDPRTYTPRAQQKSQQEVVNVGGDPRSRQPQESTQQTFTVVQQQLLDLLDQIESQTTGTFSKSQDNQVLSAMGHNDFNGVIERENIAFGQHGVQEDENLTRLSNQLITILQATAQCKSRLQQLAQALEFANEDLQGAEDIYNVVRETLTSEVDLFDDVHRVYTNQVANQSNDFKQNVQRNIKA